MRRDFEHGDEAMEQLYELVLLVARGDINVVVLGETGAGKEVVARAVHSHSPRKTEPFVAVNCAAIPATLFESELFGHERGAFTGAHSTRTGLIESAHRGTVFLDEVGEMPLSVQAKLLRAIERREITRIGASQAIAVDIRFIAATHRDLEQAIIDAEFREDLFYRLNGVMLVVPPLRQRPGSIRTLSRRFLLDACRRLARPPLAISESAMRALEAHAWPGNVRELRNVMERAALLAVGDAIELGHVRLGSSGPRAHASGMQRAAALAPESSEDLATQIAELERRRILAALEECGGNQTVAAKRLGISRRRLINRLDDYDVPRPRKRRAGDE